MVQGEMVVVRTNLPRHNYVLGYFYLNAFGDTFYFKKAIIYISIILWRAGPTVTIVM